MELYDSVLQLQEACWEWLESEHCPSSRGRAAQGVHRAFIHCAEIGVSSSSKEKNGWAHVVRLAPLFRKTLDRQAVLALLAPTERWLEGQAGESYWRGQADRAGESPPGLCVPVDCAVILENLRSGFNVGSIIRTVEALRLGTVWMTGYTPDGDQASVQKTAMGCEQHVQWAYRADTAGLVRELQAQGVRVWALETVPQAAPLDQAALTPPMALLLGNERFGVSSRTLDCVDGCLRIPLFGSKNSLNVANAFTAAAYEVRRQWRHRASASS